MQNEDCKTCHKHPPYCRCAAKTAHSQSGAQRSPAGMSAFSDGFDGNASVKSETNVRNPGWHRPAVLDYFKHLTDEELEATWLYAYNLTKQRPKNRRFIKL